MARQPEQRLLVDRGRVATVVNPDRARVDHARDAIGARRLEHVRGAAGVDALRVRGVGRDVVHIGDRAEVRDRVAASRCPRDGLHIGEIADERLELGRVMPRRIDHVEDHRFMPRVHEHVDHV